MTTVVNFVLDRSGSMSFIRDETISGFNVYIEELKKSKEKFKFFLTQFDTANPQEILYDGVPLKDIVPLTIETFVPRGGTPLLDAVAMSIEHVKSSIKRMKNPKVLTDILTDGHENASREWTSDGLNKLILEMEEVGWTFAYQGASKDAWDTPAFFQGTQSIHNVTQSGGGRGMSAGMSARAGSTVALASTTDTGKPVADFYSPEQKKTVKDA